MRYLSTRNSNMRINSADAIAQGLSRDGGLFVPEVFPHITTRTLELLGDMSYQQRAVFIMSRFLDDFSSAEITNYSRAAYNTRGFDTPEIAPLHKLDDKTYFLELWHGPTCAFKDMALQMLPHLLSGSLSKTGEKRRVCILVATSGDTGKAALEGFCDVDKTKILVFYPASGVSEIQELQMTTQKGNNVGVFAVEGNFDDAQTGVKNIFSDEKLRERLSSLGWFLSSANSINWGRLLPQIVYYISAYADMLKNGSIKSGAPVNVCVPTGNFGNILAAYYAKKMGLPIGKLICASNQNKILTDFINTGIYNRKRDFYTTISPSMDILISSNLERLLFDLSGNDDKLIAGYMNSLSKEGVYTANDKIKEQLNNLFWANYCSDEKTKLVINATFRKYDYLIDTHTAVAFDVLNHYRYDTNDETPAIVVSTASPYKFCDSVLDALGDDSGASGIALIDRLYEVTGVKPPKPLTQLKDKNRRFEETVSKEDMTKVVEEFLK